jgi:hypothetical protein
MVDCITEMRLGPSAPERADVLRRGYRGGSSNPAEGIVRLGSGSSAIDRSARSARALASFASYADPLLSHTEIVSSGPERHSDLGKAETS